MARKCLLILLILFSGCVHSKSYANYTNMVVFGDSLSDVGNFSRGCLGILPPSSKYYRGRFSNGQLWVEYEAKRLGRPAPKPSQAGGKNYAFAGAETGQGHSPFGSPNMKRQVADYLKDHQPNGTELYVLWCGANDLINVAEKRRPRNEFDPVSSVQNITSQIAVLANAGAKHFLVLNLPPLSQTPEYRNTSHAESLDRWTQQFNVHLAEEVTRMRFELRTVIELRDVHSLLSQVLGDHDKFPFTNVINAGMTRDDGQRHLFWDTIHPTSMANSMIAGRLLGEQGFASRSYRRPLPRLRSQVSCRRFAARQKTRSVLRLQYNEPRCG